MIEKLNIKVSFLGCPIFFHWSLVLLLIISAFVSLNYFFILILIFICAIIHEIGHLMGAKIAKLSCEKIVIHILGGGAYIKVSPDAPPNVMFSMVAGGPIASLILSIIFGVLTYYQNNYINLLFTINASILLFNLLPILPLDGGRLLKIFIMNYLDFMKATYLATRIGQGLALTLLGVCIVYFDILAILTILVILGISNIEFSQAKKHYVYLIFEELTKKESLSEEDWVRIEKIPYEKEKNELIVALKEQGYELAP